MIIAFIGKARSGKTTASNYLVKEHGFVRVNFKEAIIEDMREYFPDTLNEIVSVLNTLDGRNYWNVDLLFEEKPKIMRALMQNYGTEIRRAEDPEYWTSRWVKKINAMRRDHDIVVDDCRFLNEARAIRNLRGEIYRIVRNDHEEQSNHPTETEMDQIGPDFTMSFATGEHEEMYKHLDWLVRFNSQKNAS